MVRITISTGATDINKVVSVAYRITKLVAITNSANGNHRDRLKGRVALPRPSAASTPFGMPVHLMQSSILCKIVFGISPPGPSVIAPKRYGNWLETLEREQHLNGDTEMAGNLHGQLQAGRIVAAFEISDRLRVHANRIG